MDDAVGGNSRASRGSFFIKKRGTSVIDSSCGVWFCGDQVLVPSDCWRRVGAAVMVGAGLVQWASVQNSARGDE
jgi:hypothetical protein